MPGIRRITPTIVGKCMLFVTCGLWLMHAGPAKPDQAPPQVSGVPVPEGQIEKSLGQLDGLAAGVMARSGIPGMAVAVVRHGQVVYAKGFGIRKVGGAEKIDTDTVFQIASLSKSVASTVIAHQVATGVISWETPIVRNLPWFQLQDPWVTAHVTIADMLSHRSGLPDHAGDDLEDLGYGRRQVLERLRLLPLAPFRLTYAYTNFGFTAGAEAVAVASGQSWEDLADKVLYQPLGMHSTSSRFSGFEGRTNRASGHVAVDGRYQPKYQRMPHAQAPAGGVSSSVNDLARWMIMVLQNGSFEGRDIIRAGALLPAITGQTISAPARTADSRASLYGYGFGVGVTAAGRVEIKHSGAFAMGVGTTFSLLPSLGVGIVVLTNAQPVGAAETLANDFTDLVQFGRIERDWFAAYQPFMAPLTAPVGKLVGQRPPASPARAAEPSRYAGVYRNDYYGDVQVVTHGRSLALKLGPSGQEYALSHWDGDSFVFSPTSENQPDGSISLVTFRPAAPADFRSLAIEYLDHDGMGTFVRQ